MTVNPHAPESIILKHGMEHAGISPTALQVERSREFKRSFVDTVSPEIGWGDGRIEIVADEEIPGLAGFLSSFTEDGHPGDPEVQALVEGALGIVVDDSALVFDCCYWVKGVWYTCGGYTFTRDGQPWTIEAAVAEYESRHGKIEDAAVRAELAAIPVYVQIEWEITI